jgi:hypothetical protein
MYFTLILENESGEQVNLSTTANQYMTSKIEGLNPPAGTVSTSSYAGMNGSYLNNAFIEKRNVVISFAMRGIGIEKRRHQLYHVVKPSQYIKIWYKTANIDVYAEGYVETCEVSNFEQQISGQISIPITAASPEHFIFPFRRAMLRFLWVCIPTVMPYPLPMTEMKPDSHCELRHCPATFRRKWWQ